MALHENTISAAFTHRPVPPLLAQASFTMQPIMAINTAPKPPRSRFYG
jgi:hypothetical protein